MVFSDQQKLLFAARAGNLEETTLLINRGVPADGIEGEPLFAAIAGRHLDVIKILLANHASVEVTDQYGDGPLEYALHHQEDKIVFELLSYGAKLRRRSNDRYKQLLEQSLKRINRGSKE